LNGQGGSCTIVESEPEDTMKVILASLLAAIVIAVGAALILNTTQRTAYEVFKGAGADIRDPGHNLVGENWTGNARPGNG
jgi:hypothetical protein